MSRERATARGLMRPQQSTPFLQGDLTPRRSDFVDLRNDNAGSHLQQAESIVLRYLQALPAQDTVDLESMVKDITRHYPFHGDSVDFFREVVSSLETSGWVKFVGDELQLDKIASVAKKYLVRCLRASR